MSFSHGSGTVRVYFDDPENPGKHVEGELCFDLEANTDSTPEDCCEGACVHMYKPDGTEFGGIINRRALLAWASNLVFELQARLNAEEIGSTMQGLLEFIGTHGFGTRPHPDVRSIIKVTDAAKPKGEYRRKAYSNEVEYVPPSPKL